jgi:ubiquinone/menaquinone biosynthesis C-methylase UbiE
VQNVSGIFTALANLSATGLGALLGFKATLRAQHNLQPHPLPHQFASLLDHPWRLQMIDPPQVLDLYGVAAGITVLDLGCGAGLFTCTAAHMVGAQGRVHGVDLQAAMLALAAERAINEGVSDWVSMHHCGAYDLPLPDDSVDIAVVVSTLGEIPNKPAALNELRRVLKPGGRLGVTEEMYSPSFVLPHNVHRQVQEAGFQPLVNAGAFLIHHEVFINAK